MLNLDRNAALILIAQTEFRPFNLVDYDVYAGVEGDNPYIGESNDYIIILDGNMVQLIDAEGNFKSFFLGE